MVSVWGSDRPRSAVDGFRADKFTFRPSRFRRAVRGEGTVCAGTLPSFGARKAAKLGSGSVLVRSNNWMCGLNNIERKNTC